MTLKIRRSLLRMWFCDALREKMFIIEITAHFPAIRTNLGSFDFHCRSPPRPRLPPSSSRFQVVRISPSGRSVPASSDLPAGNSISRCAPLRLLVPSFLVDRGHGVVLLPPILAPAHRHVQAPAVAAVRRSAKVCQKHTSGSSFGSSSSAGKRL